MSETALELKKKIGYYTIFGNNLKDFLGEQQLKDLKKILDQLKGTIDEKAWGKLIGRSYDCYIREIDYNIALWQHGTHPEQNKPVPAPQPWPTPTPQPQPDQSTKPTPTPGPLPTPDPTPTPTPDNSRPPTPEPKPEEKPKPATPEELETAKYDKLLKELKAETDPEKLKDGGTYSQAIDALNYQLLTLEKQPQYLHDARTERRSDLLDKEKEKNWQAWFKQRQILQEADQKAWRSLKNDKEAEAMYNDALAKDSEGTTWDPALTEEEKKAINDSKSPGALQNTQSTIKNKRDNIKIATDLLNDLENWTELSTIPRSRDIQTKYKEEYVPDNLKYAVLKEARNKKRAELFKAAFNGGTPTQLTDTEIEAWRKGSDQERGGTTGLNGLGVEERTAFNNKWTIEEIINRQIKQIKAKATAETAKEEIITDIDPLAVNKEQLIKALEILSDINDETAHQTFKSLPENYRNAEIKALPNDLPGIASPEYLINRIKARRNTFSLSLNQEDDDAFNQAKLDEILGKLKELYPMAEYKPFTADLANEILRYNITKDEKPVAKLTPTIDEDLEPWLTAPEQKGYRIEDEPKQFIDGQPPIKGKEYTGAEVVAQEDEWAINNERDKQSKLLLPFFCKKVDYDYNTPEAFLREPGNKTKGKLPYATGSGKTTKIVMCLTCIMREKGVNVVLVLPTSLLKSSAANHHKSWLQEYECSLHDKKHGEYKVNVDELGEGLSILYYPYLAGYIIRELLNWKTKPLRDLEKIKGIADKIAAIKEGTILKKLNPLIAFDEGHWVDGTYQALKDGALELGYKVLEMSATFEGVPWSITTPYKGVDRKVDGFKPEHIGETDKTGIFIKNKLNDKQKEALKKAGVCYVEFDAGMAPAAEGITMGLPPGSVFFFTWIYEAGVTMDLMNIILTNWLETQQLGGGWAYDPPATQKNPIASLGQQRGRVNRLYKGRAYFLVNKDGKLEYEEVKQTDDAGTVFLKYALTGDEKWAKKIKYKDFKDLNMVRLCLAWPDKFGLRPEEILIGVQLGIAPEGKYPKFPEIKPQGRPDEDLWDRHLKVVKPNDMPEQTAKDIISQMIGNLLVSPRKGNQFPYSVNIVIESPLITQIKWKADNKPGKKKDPKDPNEPIKWVKQDNTASINEARSMINAKIDQVLKKLPDYQAGAIKYKNEDTFNKIVGIYRMIDGLKITIKQEFKDELIDKKKPELGYKPKETLTLRINYGDGSTKRTFFFDRYHPAQPVRQPLEVN